MENELPHQDRIEIHSNEIGEIERAALEKRAMELARIDGRDFWNKRDLQAAADELSGASSQDTDPEVVEPIIGELVAWDEPPESDGHAVPRTPIENEANVAEILVNEGLEEAEHDRRLAEDPPEELE